MSYYRYRSWKYTIDQDHGFGIRYYEDVEENPGVCVYYEDDTFIRVENASAPGTSSSFAADSVTDDKRAETLARNIQYVIDTAQRDQRLGIPKATMKKIDAMMEAGSCIVKPGDGDSIVVQLKDGERTVEVKAFSEQRRYYAEHLITCNCKDRTCMHKKAVPVIFCNRLRELKHRYVVTSQPVDKSLLLEERLEESTGDGIVRDYDMESVEKVHAIVQLLDSAGSPDYYRRFHEWMLDWNPYYYDAHFLEEYSYLLLALFDHEKYREAVIEPGSYADPVQYEDRQHRSNRACFKRILKEYGKVTKEMDARGDYSHDGFKEFLLKLRGDDAGLLKYYAVGKESLEGCDLPYLERIALDPEADRESIRLTMVKMDTMPNSSDAAPVFRKLAAHLPHEEVVQLYGSLRNMSLTMEEIRSLPRQEQLSLIYNTPLDRDSFVYIMEDLLDGKEASQRGHFLLSALPKASRDTELKAAILESALNLPYNRLLLPYVAWRLKLDKILSRYLADHSEGIAAEEPSENRTEDLAGTAAGSTGGAAAEGSAGHSGDNAALSASELELSTYFDCGYRIENRKDSFSVIFTVADPLSTQYSLIEMEEEDGKPVRNWCVIRNQKYDAEVIKKVCLSGREKEYALTLEKNQDSVDEYLFGKNNRKFLTAYQKLCDSFQEEKILFRAEERAEIEWMIYREDSSNALAFKVGNTRKYIVKDASEFLDAFKSGQTIQYGKDLILTHDPDNLNDSDAAMIKLLMAVKTAKGRKSDKKNRRYLTVSDSVLAGLFEGLSGRMISYNDEPCLVRLEKQKVRLLVDRKYVLSTDLQKGKQEFLNLIGKGYVVTSRGESLPLVIDCVEGNAGETGLIELVDQNPRVSIRPILKDFKKNVYSRYFELFDVDKSLAEDFRLSAIRLNTYFDYEKSAITLETKIYKNDKLITPDQLNEKMDLSRYELLQNYLTELGFCEGVLEDESRILSFFKMDFTRLKSLTNVYLSEQLQNKEIKSIGRPVIRVTYKNNIVQAFLEKSEYSEEDLQKILAGIRKKKKFILLSDNRIVDLDSDAARDFADTVQDFGLNPKDLYHKKQISMVTAIKAFAHEKSCKADRYLRDMIEEIRSFKEADIPVPRLAGELRDYQTEGFNWLTILSRYGMGGILADDMGLGKTIQVIAMIRADSTRKPSLVVCPKSLVFNWISEFARFDPETEVVEIYGTDSVRKERIAGINYKKKTVYVTSYDSLRNDISSYTGEFNYGILDEAQYIKNVHAQKTKSVKELKICHRFALTGTPIENSVVDLWSIFDFIMPGYFEELSRFRESDTAGIARKAAPFILRRVKEDVLDDLPPKYERVLTADMGREQRRLYEAMRMDARKRLEEGGKAFDVLPYLTRLRQICVDPGMFLDHYTGGSGKLDLLETLIPEYLENGHRILIFSQFVKALESVRSLLEKLQISSYFLSGATSAKDRIDMMDSFNNGSGTDVFLVSLKAGGTGLNLTGADTVIHLDPWWNVAAENQASDRTHRIGQKRNVEVLRLIAEDSIEQRVVELQAIKTEVIRQVISDDDGSVTSASLEDIAFVLG